MVDGGREHCDACWHDPQLSLQVLSWGNNRYGQLGHGDKVEQIVLVEA